MQCISLKGQGKKGITSRNKVEESRTEGSNAEKILGETAGNKLNTSEMWGGKMLQLFGSAEQRDNAHSQSLAVTGTRLLCSLGGEAAGITGGGQARGTCTSCCWLEKDPRVFQWSVMARREFKGCCEARESLEREDSFSTWTGLW